jgi:hypothetical protein
MRYGLARAPAFARFPDQQDGTDLAASYRTNDNNARTREKITVSRDGSLAGGSRAADDRSVEPKVARPFPPVSAPLMAASRCSASSNGWEFLGRRPEPAERAGRNGSRKRHLSCAAAPPRGLGSDRTGDTRAGTSLSRSSTCRPARSGWSGPRTPCRGPRGDPIVGSLRC